MKDKGSKVEVTVWGAELAVDADNLNDLDVLDWLDEIQSGNVLKLKKLLVRILGDDWGKAHEAIKKGGSVARADAAAEFLMALFGEIEAKN